MRGGYYIVVAFLGAIQFDDVIYKATAAGQESMVAIRIDKTCQVGCRSSLRHSYGAQSCDTACQVTAVCWRILRHKCIARCRSSKLPGSRAHHLGVTRRGQLG